MLTRLIGLATASTTALIAALATTPASAMLLNPATGTALTFSDRDNGSTSAINLGLSGFNFFGTPQSTVNVNVNGSLSFNGGNSGGSGTASIPFTSSSISSTRLIAPFLDDLVLSSGGASGSGNVLLNTTAPGKFIVTWSGVGVRSTQTNSVTAQAVLYGAGNADGLIPGTIAFSYASPGSLFASRGDVTIGLNAGNGTYQTLASVLPPGANANGTIASLQARTWLPSSGGFLFTPNGNSYSVQAVPFEFSPGLGILALGACGAIAQLKSKVQKWKFSGRCTNEA